MAWFECTGGQPAPAPTPVLESYIYNVGNAAFNTGYNHKANTKIKTKMSIDVLSGQWKPIWGHDEGTWRTNAFSFSTGDNSKIALMSKGSWTQGDVWNAAESSGSAVWNNIPCIFEASGNSIIWYKEADPTIIRSLTTSTYIDDAIAPLAIFNNNQSTSADGWNLNTNGSCYIVFYWFEIYEDNTLLHRFVPAYNNNQWCLYDEIDEVYKYDTINNGTTLRGCLVQP